MRVAYYFISEPEYPINGLPYYQSIRSCFKSVLGTPVKVNSVLFTGKIPEQYLLKEYLLSPPSYIWQYFVQGWVKHVLRGDINCIVFKSLPIINRDHIHQQLLQTETLYLGCSQVTSLIHESWLIHSHIPLGFSVKGKSVYRLVPPGELRMDRMDWLLDEFKQMGFEEADEEELGIRHSYLDEFNSLDHEVRLEKSVMLIRKYAGVENGELAENVTARLDECSPRLSERFADAAGKLGATDEYDPYNQLAVTCRNLMVFVADAIYPANELIAHGMKVKWETFKNRVVAYTLDLKEKNILNETESQEVIKHTKEWFNLVNKGVHPKSESSLSEEDVQRLLVSILHVLDKILPSPSKIHLTDEDIRQILDMLDLASDV